VRRDAYPGDVGLPLTLALVGIVLSNARFGS
jgi:hypothetical protein